MRELISLGALAVLMSVLASPVFAGNVEECEVLKRGATKGLYKLCLAYHNTANSDAKERFLNKYNETAGPDDPPMPGTEPVVVTCPCLEDPNVVGIEDWGFKVSCTLDVDGTDQGIFVNPELSNLTTIFTTTTDDVVHMCNITQSPSTFVTLAINAEEYDECLFQLLMLCL